MGTVLICLFYMMFDRGQSNTIAYPVIEGEGNTSAYLALNP